MTKMMMLALAGATMLATPAMAVELVVNGGFDLDTSVPSGGFTIYNAGDTIGGGGWTVVGDGANSSLNLHTNYAESNVAFVSQAGPNALDLTAAANTGPNSGVFQDISTTAGGVYRLSFFLGNADGSGNANYPLASSVALSIGGGPAMTYTNSDVTFQTINWQENSVLFTATGATTRIQFNNATAAADNYAGLDSVSVTAVPEPAAWALMIGGFGVAGSALRRRRTTVRFA